MNDESTLKDLYEMSSKHAHYQILPPELNDVINAHNITIQSRFEAERLKYILDNIDIKDKYILDIGGNTGYFTFEMLSHGAKHVDYFEGNSNHAKFVRLAAKSLHYESKLSVFDEYHSFIFPVPRNYDVVLLLNVLHHVGDDYGNQNLSLENAKRQILLSLENVAWNTKYLIFQLGFNWKGDRNQCLFENGTKKELLDFICSGTKNCWDILKIGIPGRVSNKVIYSDLDEVNAMRLDELGEFLNRPLFIMKSLLYAEKGKKVGVTPNDDV